LIDQKGIILQGDHGYSQKGSDPGNASIYYSQTRLESTGTLSLDGKNYPLHGLSWLDREISTSALSKGQVGWDWFALQLDDGSELMAYVLRRADGTPDAFSNGTLIHPDGTTISLSQKDFQIQSTATWRSPHSAGNYPAQWTVSVPSEDLILQVKPLLADQELNLSFTYWEGAVEIQGTHAGGKVSGSGYVELTGYARSLEGGF
jgi:predicted secreted hydrolase